MYATIPGYNTKKSSYVCAVYTVIIKILSIISALFIMFRTEEYERFRENISGHPYKVKRDFYPFAVMHCSLYLISGIILYYGVKNNKPKLLIPHMFETVIDVGVKMLLFMILLIEGTTEGLLVMCLFIPVLLVLFAVLIYEVVIVASHYHSLVTQSEKELYSMEVTTKLQDVSV